MTKALTQFRNINDLKVAMAGEHRKSLENILGSPEKALEFLSNMAESVRRTPKLLECTPGTVINSFMTMASLNLMPSGVSGEAFVIPYKNKGVMEAQFQLGYQGLVTLLYRAGNKEVISELVRENDKFSISRGKIVHEVDPRKTKEQRGKVIGAYSIIVTPTGGSVETYMAMDDILAHAKKFSKSFASDFSPWNPESDPEGWMPRKTVLKQNTKLAPKSKELVRAIHEDNKDSIISDRLPAAMTSSKELTMGALIKPEDGNDEERPPAQDSEGIIDITPEGPEGDQEGE